MTGTVLHVLSALALTALGRLLGFGIEAGLAVSTFFFAREVTQAEYRWIERYGMGLRANMPWHAILQPKAWTLKALADWIAPAIMAAGMALLPWG